MALKKKQKTCIDMLVDASMSQKEIAQALGVAEQTICRWKRDEEFAAEYSSRLRKKIHLAAAKAFKTEQDLLLHSESDKVRLGAAKDILDRAGFKPKDEISLTQSVDDSLREMQEYFENRQKADTGSSL